MKRFLLLLAVPLLLGSLGTTVAHADASIVQDSCIVVSENPKIIRIYFTAVNFSLPDVLCDIHFIPEPQPVLPECEMLACGPVPGWTCSLNPFGGADYFANALGDCIPQLTAKGGFYFEIDPGFCCYVVQFTGPDGSVLLEQEECFTICPTPVPTRDKTWGGVKGKYKGK